MKKALFVIAALALSMTAGAKYWFSGSLGIDSALSLGLVFEF